MERSPGALRRAQEVGSDGGSYEQAAEAVTPEGYLAERVGFVPEGPAPLNDLRRIGTARTRPNLDELGVAVPVRRGDRHAGDGWLVVGSVDV